MDYSEQNIQGKFVGVLEEQKVQEGDKIEQFSRGKKKNLTYFTSFSTDIFDILTDQLQAIQESLKGEKLLEFVKRMMDQLVSLTTHVVDISLEKLEPRNSRELVSLVIRLNDLTKVVGEFTKFKDLAVTTIGE